MKKFALISSLILAGTFFYYRRSSASSLSVLERANSINIVGDSQVKRHIGESYEEIFPNKDVSFFGKEGATHITYIENPELLDEAVICSDITIIQLGDNGVSANLEKIETFISLVKDRCPNTTIVWSGPMKAVRPSVRSSYVNVDDPSSNRYIHTYNDMRNTWNKRLSSKLSDLGIPYVDNFNAHSEGIPNLDANRGGDGVHLTEESAFAQVNLLRNKLKGLR